MNKTQEIIEVNCPICQKTVEWSSKSPFRPFCSKRCQVIDLGDWASEEHRIEGKELTEADVWSEDELFQLAEQQRGKLQ